MQANSFAPRHQYFSSLERLRFAHDVCPSNTRSRPQSSRRPSTSHTLYSRSHSVPCINQGTFPGTLGVGVSQARLRRAFRLDNPPSIPLTPQEFVALPATIRRKYFAPEEQYYIASQLTPVILDAADEACLYKNNQPRRSTTTAHSLICLDENDEEEDWEHFDSDAETLEEMDINDLESFRWLDSDHDVDLKLDDYPVVNQEISPTKPPASPHGRTFRRGFSFSNVSLRRRSSSSISTRSSAVFGPKSMMKTGPLSTTIHTSRHQSKDSVSSLNPTATHYQDPAAKMKLRVYLASPQKFDEALEFGFPSLQREALHSTGRPRTSPDYENGQAKTFFSDDTPSLSDDDQEDVASIHHGQDTPTTPIDMSFPGQRASHKSSTDRSFHMRPRIVTESYAYALATEREMTLKMTLTRPELRNIEADHIPSYDINDRPLEKAPLTVPFDANQSIWDELPEPPSRMRRFFQKFKGRS